MAQSDVTSNSPLPAPDGDGPAPPRPDRPRRRIPGFLLFGIIAATVEMGIVIALLYC